MNTYPFISREFPLVLASESPRRKSLLEQADIPFRIIPGNIDENSIKGTPSYIAKTLAEKKAHAVLHMADKQWILGADTIVLSGNVILGKPSDEDDTRSMLNLLSGKEHEVITGYAVIDPSGKTACSDQESTIVSIKPLTSGEIDAYIATGEPFGKAGSYAIQGIGSLMIEGIQGSYSNVVGLPLCAIIRNLLNIGALKKFPILL
jgi:septum formation protein